MARNPIQFQAGFSLPAFLKQYRTEEQCQSIFFQHRSWLSQLDKQSSIDTLPTL